MYLELHQTKRSEVCTQIRGDFVFCNPIQIIIFFLPKNRKKEQFITTYIPNLWLFFFYLTDYLTVLLASHSNLTTRWVTWHRSQREKMTKIKLKPVTPNTKHRTVLCFYCLIVRSNFRFLFLALGNRWGDKDNFQAEWIIWHYKTIFLPLSWKYNYTPNMIKFHLLCTQKYPASIDSCIKHNKNKASPPQETR